MCKPKKVNLETIQLLIDKCADVNKGNPLGYLCKQIEVNIEALQLLLDHGADVNKEFGFHGAYTPFGCLCNQK